MAEPPISRGFRARRQLAGRQRKPNEPGFREAPGYRDYGDPWRERRYAGG